MADDIVWRLINKGFCSNKVRLINKDFCREEHNVTGLCTKTSCPLANSKYATVLEHDGICFLYIKTAERCNNPKRQWERIPLSKSYAEALKQIEAHLKYWPHRQINICKLRLTRLRQTFIRMRRMALRDTRELVTINKKVERRDLSRLKKAEVAARIEGQIKKELYQRLLKGTYPTDMFNLHKCFPKLLEEQGIADEARLAEKRRQLREQATEQEEELDAEAAAEQDVDTQLEAEEAAAAASAKRRAPTQFVEDYADGEAGASGRGKKPTAGDIEDLAGAAAAAAPRPKPVRRVRKPRLPFVEIEQEEEHEMQSSTN